MNTSRKRACLVIAIICVSSAIIICFRVSRKNAILTATKYGDLHGVPFRNYEICFPEVNECFPIYTWKIRIEPNEFSPIAPIYFYIRDGRVVRVKQGNQP